MATSPKFGTQSVEKNVSTERQESQMEKEVRAAIQSEMEVINSYKQLLEDERTKNQQTKDLYETTITQLQAQVNAASIKTSEEESKANAEKRAEEYINRFQKSEKDIQIERLKSIISELK